MRCFVIVQFNGSWRRHTPVFSSPLQGTGHDPSHIVPHYLPTALPSSRSSHQNRSLAEGLCLFLTWDREHRPQPLNFTITINSCCIRLNVYRFFCRPHSWFFLLLHFECRLSCVNVCDKDWQSLTLFSRPKWKECPEPCFVYIVHIHVFTHIRLSACQRVFTFACVCVSVDVRPWRRAPLLPLIQRGSSAAQGTHQPVTHNYLKDLGESSCPQIIVKTPDSQKAAAYVAEALCIRHNSGCSLFQTLFPYVFKSTRVFMCAYSYIWVWIFKTLSFTALTCPCMCKYNQHNANVSLNVRLCLHEGVQHAASAAEWSSVTSSVLR